MLPDVLQAGALAPFDALVRSISSTLLVPIGLGLFAYIWLCFTARHR